MVGVTFYSIIRTSNSRNSGLQDFIQDCIQDLVASPAHGQSSLILKSINDKLHFVFYIYINILRCVLAL